VTTATALAPRSAPGRVLMRPGVATAVALYIGVTGLVYFFVLRHLGGPEGQQYCRPTLHYATPVLYLIFWLLAVMESSPQTSSRRCWCSRCSTLRIRCCGVRSPTGILSVPRRGQARYGEVAANIVFLIAGFALDSCFSVSTGWSGGCAAYRPRRRACNLADDTIRRRNRRVAGDDRILGVDPGLRRTGWGVIGSGQHAHLVDAGTIRAPLRRAGAAARGAA
jgi:hypothetical protein